MGKCAMQTLSRREQFSEPELERELNFPVFFFIQKRYKRYQKETEKKDQ